MQLASDIRNMSLWKLGITDKLNIKAEKYKSILSYNNSPVQGLLLRFFLNLQLVRGYSIQDI